MVQRSRNARVMHAMRRQKRRTQKLMIWRDLSGRSLIAVSLPPLDGTPRISPLCPLRPTLSKRSRSTRQEMTRLSACTSRRLPCPPTPLPQRLVGPAGRKARAKRHTSYATMGPGRAAYHSRPSRAMSQNQGKASSASWRLTVVDTVCVGNNGVC